MVTPNHPVWVIGMGILDEYNNVSNQYESYPQPHWKRVDQLKQHEMMVNNEGFYLVLQECNLYISLKMKIIKRL